MRFPLLAALALSCLPTASGASQMDPIWTRTLPAENQQGSDSFVSNILGLRDGGVLIGSARRTEPTVIESVLTKLDANGTPAWEQVFGSSQTASFSIAAYRFFHLEENAAGEILAIRSRPGDLQAAWLTSEGQPISSNPVVGWVRAMPDGGYVTARGGGALVAIVQRFRRDGSPVWTRTLAGTVNELTVDALGNVFVFGRNQDLQDVPFPMLAVRITMDGDVRGTWCQSDTFCTPPWQGWFDREDVWNDWFRAPVDFVLDARGHAYMLLGNVTGGVPGRIVAFDRTGAMTWFFDFENVAPSGFASRLAVDSDGSLRVLGANVQGSTLEYLITRLAPDGTELWTRTSATYEAFFLADPVLDEEGRVFAGVSHSVGGSERYTVFGYDAAGASLGTAETPGTVFPAGTQLNAVHLTVDRLGGVFIGQANVPDAGASYEVRSAVASFAVGGLVGTTLCAQPTPNSSGMTGRLQAFGSSERPINDVTLVADQLPAGATTLFFTGTAEVASMFPGGSQGTLCAGGSIGRYLGPGQVMASGTDGRATLRLDLGMTPSPTMSVNVMVGETRFFQAWHRDANPGVTSNFTEALSVTFR